MTAAKSEYFFGERPREFLLDPERFDQHMERLEQERDLNLLPQLKPEIIHRENIGLVVGRFHPPHPGHFDVFEMALWYAKKIKIGIGSANVLDNDNNPCPLWFREERLWNGVRKRGIEQYVEGIVYLNDYVSDEFWFKETLRKTGDIDVVIGNNDIVNRIFQGGGIKTQGVPYIDRNRFQGTVIRQDLRREVSYEINKLFYKA